MEGRLEEKDVSDWVYKGEGAANIVLGYTGSSLAYVGKVLRIQKCHSDGDQSTTPTPLLSTTEVLLWKDDKGIVSSTSKETVGQLYVQNVILPLLGSNHVDAGIIILVTKGFLEAIESNILFQRPAWRVDAAKINTICDSALLISDHSIFPHGILKGDPCIAVEIKVSQVSEYNPLDLFSGRIERIKKAVQALFTTPQNNFRIFLNGSLVFGGLGGGEDNCNFLVGEAMENLIEGVIAADHGLRLPIFLELVAEAIFKSGILNRLLKVQMIDSLDIEGAIHAYYNIISQPCKACRDLDDFNFSQRYSTLHSMSLKESLKIVRDYLISATAEDCSLMICFRPNKSGNQQFSYSSIDLESTKQSFEYKAYFIDLDMKPLKKMAYYYELDQEIVNCYTKMADLKNGLYKSKGLQVVKI